MKRAKDSFRYYVLIQQFQLQQYKSIFEKPMKESLERMFHFIYNHTDIHDIKEITEYLLYQYFFFHHSKKFSIAPFATIIKDIKNFIRFKNRVYPTMHYELDFDISVAHFAYLLTEKRRERVMDATKLKSEINNLIHNELLPIYRKFKATKNLNSLMFLDEILADVQSKLENLKKVDIAAAEHIYQSKLQNLPSKDQLLDEYLVGR